MKLSIINILKAYSTVSPEEKDVKMVTVSRDFSSFFILFSKFHRLRATIS